MPISSVIVSGSNDLTELVVNSRHEAVKQGTESTSVRQGLGYRFVGETVARHYFIEGDISSGYTLRIRKAPTEGCRALTDADDFIGGDCN